MSVIDTLGLYNKIINLAETDKKWVDDPVDTVLDTIVSFLEELN